jgi:photosystem II stability/assembly factor-like uncharacterized protein
MRRNNTMLTTIVTLSVLFTVSPVHAGINQWTSSGPVGRAVSTLLLDPKNSAILYAGTDGGVFKSVDNGATWRGSSLTNSVSVLAVNPQMTTTVYAGADTVVFRSVDGGGSWTTVSLPRRFLQALIVDPVTPTTVYAGYGETQYEPIGFGCCTRVVAGGVLKSTDSGATWNDLSITLTPINGFAFDHTNPAILYAHFFIPSLVSSGNGRSGVLKTTDGGTTWTEIAADTPVPNFSTAMAVDPHHPDIIYHAAWRSLLRSMDRGKTWFSINNGVDEACGLSPLVIDPSGTWLHVGSAPCQEDEQGQGTGGVFSLRIEGTLPNDLLLTLESPEDGQAVSGIDVIRGWSFPSRDGLAVGDINWDFHNISCCFAREDVRDAFPQFPSDRTLRSGWGEVINWGDYGSGTQSLGVSINSARGRQLFSTTRAVTVVKLGGFPFVYRFDLSEAETRISENALVIDKVQVWGDRFGTRGSILCGRFRWFTHAQALRMVESECGPTVSATRSLFSPMLAAADRVWHWLPTLVTQGEAAEGIRSYWESPIDGQPVAGIAPIRGWAFPEAEMASIRTVRLAVDGGPLLDIPCCSFRLDVSDEFNVGGVWRKNVVESGWGMVLNYGDFPSGNHTLSVQLEASNGASQTLTRSINTIRIGGFSFIDQFDLDGATPRLDGEEIELAGVRVRDKATQQTKTITVRLRWVQDLQSLGLVASSL